MTNRVSLPLVLHLLPGFPPARGLQMLRLRPRPRSVPNAATKPSRPKIDLSEGLPESFANPQKGKQHDQ